MPGVKTTHGDYDAFSPKWRRVRDVVAGQDAMHCAGELYLPKLKDETDPDYNARRKRSDFFNATWRTIDALGGMAFRKPPTEDVPAAIVPYLKDVNLAGMTMEGFAKECVEEVLGPGRIGILVDHPAPPENTVPITVAAAQQMGLRPTLQLYTAESIRNWKFARVNNSWVLSMVVLGETEMVAEDEFTDKPEDRYRVLDLGGAGGTYRQRLFKVEGEKDIQIGGDIVPTMSGKPLDFIPFAWAGTGGRNDATDEPPLIDLIDKNVAHYQVNADYRHGLHFAGLPTLFLAGLQPDDGGKFYIGSSAAILATDPHAKASFIEFQGQGLGAIEKSLDRLEMQMALLGARMIADETKQVETLGATQIKRAGENSVLAKIVQSISETLEWALSVFSAWADASGTVTYQINRDFTPALMDGRELLALVSAVQAGALTDREFFELMQRGDVVDGSTTFEQHQEELKAQGPPKPVMPAPGAKPGQAAA